MRLFQHLDSASVTMSTTISIRILLVGRNASVANALATLFAANRTLPAELPDDDPDDDPDERGYLLEFFAVTNQKAALDQIRVQPPSIIMLETNAKSES